MEEAAELSNYLPLSVSTPKKQCSPHACAGLPRL